MEVMKGPEMHVTLVGRAEVPVFGEMCVTEVSGVLMVGEWLLSRNYII